MFNKQPKNGTSTAKALYLTDADFKSVIAQANADKIPVFVDFFAEWCGPCKMAAPVIDKLAGDYAGKIIVAKVDVDQNTIAKEYGVMSIPTVVIIKGDTEVDRKTGFPGEAGYIEMIEKALK